MLRKTIFATVVVAGLAIATPASAGGRFGGGWNGGWNGGSSSSSGGHQHYPGCGHGGSSSSSGGSSSSSGGTPVPEPGMLGIAGAGLVGLGLMRRRRAART